MYNFVMDLFYKCDDRDREGEASKDLAMNLRFVSRFIEVLGVLKPLEADLD